jgi:hypothetical protein
VVGPNRSPSCRGFGGQPGWCCRHPGNCVVRPWNQVPALVKNPARLPVKSNPETQADLPRFPVRLGTAAVRRLLLTDGPSNDDGTPVFAWTARRDCCCAVRGIDPEISADAITSTD